MREGPLRSTSVQASSDVTARNGNRGVRAAIRFTEFHHNRQTPEKI
jgi:hypothetical protein